MRSPIDFVLIQEFAPTRVVTLIDDVYSCWYRTEQRAKSHRWIGQPTLADLVQARTAEVLVGDMIAGHVSTTERHVRNYVLAVKHPVSTLSRLSFQAVGSSALVRAYLSFPISKPRNLLASGDSTGIEEVNAFLRHAADFEQKHANVVFFYPVTIDELPFARALDGIDEHPGHDIAEISFPLRLRWNVQEFFGTTPLLASEGLPDSITVPRAPLGRARALLEADVAFRDFRLVQQSDRLVVFNPWYRDEMSKGVYAEIDCARLVQKPVHIFQDPAHDTKSEFVQYYGQQPGALGAPISANYTIRHQSLDEMFDSLLE